MPAGRTLVADDGQVKTYQHTDAAGNVIGSSQEPYGPAIEQLEADATDRTSLRSQILNREAKARAILADPAGAPDWTAAERKVAIACLVLFLCRELRNG